MKTNTPEARNQRLHIPEALKKIQEDFGKAMGTPFLFAGDGGDYTVEMSAYPHSIVAQMVEDHGLTGAERLAVYNQQYWFRLFTIMQEEFPLLRHLIGVAELNKLTSTYLHRYPSKSHYLQKLSDQLPGFLEEDHPWNLEILKQAARLEILYIHAFDAPQVQPLDPTTRDEASLLEQPLAFQPHLYLFEEDWDLVACREKCKDDKDDRVDVEPSAQKSWWMIFRAGVVRAERLGPIQYILLQLLMGGMPLAAAVETLSEILDEEQLAFLTEHIQEWFAWWTGLGWLAA